MRHSIDRLKDTKQRSTLFYIVLGAQKAGTTPLYDYINQHPWVVKAQQRETHCLDWRWNETLKTPKSQLEWCQKLFYTQEHKSHPSLVQWNVCQSGKNNGEGHAHASWQKRQTQNEERAPFGTRGSSSSAACMEEESPVGVIAFLIAILVVYVYDVMGCGRSCVVVAA